MDALIMLFAKKVIKSYPIKASGELIPIHQTFMNATIVKLVSLIMKLSAKMATGAIFVTVASNSTINGILKKNLILASDALIIGRILLS